jgi:DNA-binding NarL/FixJ family response regulator
MLVEGHPAVRTGLERVLASEPGLSPVATAEHESALWPALHRLRPDVVLLDYSLPGSDGLTLCFRVKQTGAPPAILVYSAYADPSLAVVAKIAQADGLIDKAAPINDLIDAVARVARGETVMPSVPPDLAAAASARLDSEDVPIMDMLLSRTPLREIAETLHLDARLVVAGGLRIVGCLQARNSSWRR